MYAFSTAATAPPIASTRESSSRAASASSRVRASITREPANRSSYSSRSVS